MFVNALKTNAEVSKILCLVEKKDIKKVVTDILSVSRKWNVSASMHSQYYTSLEEEENLGGYYVYINLFNLASSHYLVCVIPSSTKKQMCPWEPIYQENQLLYSQQEAIAVFISSSSST